MNTTLYLLSQVNVIILVLLLLGLTYRGLRHAFQKLNLTQARQAFWFRLLFGGISIWLLILSVASWSGFFQNFSSIPPRVLLVFVFPLFFIIYLLNSSTFTKILKQIPPSWFIYIQSFRILMEIILWIGFLGNFIPPQMTFEWLNYDILVGVSALGGGFLFFGKRYFRRFEAIIWNVFGIVLLINIVIIATLSTPSAFQVFYNEPHNTFVASFPFIWIPGFIVPFALAMHLFSLKQMAILSRNIHT